MIKGKNRIFGSGPAVIFLLFASCFSIFIISTVSHAGDHLSSSNSCTPCHGTNIRSVHDYEETIPTDCNICHVTQGKNWYLNETCASYLTEGGVPVVAVDTDLYALDLPEYSDFNFECKICHISSNPGHQQ
jgi:hypothetical protein